MSNRVAVVALAAVLTGLLVAVVIGSTGGDGDSGGTSVEPPELTVPGGSGSGGDTRTGERTDRGTTEDSGATGDEQTTPAPSGEDTGGAAPAQPEDTQQNDTPPPSDSPAQRFEQFCEQNPGAC